MVSAVLALTLLVLATLALLFATGRLTPVPGDHCTPPPAAREVEVNDASSLARALAAARPGDWIHLAPGTYPGRFEASANGTSTRGTVVCGPRSAILDGGSIDAGYGFHLTADYWTLAGFTVTNSQKGIVLDGANHDVLRDLEVFGIGDEGVHFRAFSTSDVLEGSVVRNVGLHSPHDGEGVYVGSAVTNWREFGRGQPDRSDGVRIVGNRIGPNTTAESVDIKEGTTGTVVEGNTFDGSGMTAADSWVDAKGNGALVRGNTGRTSPRDGFQTHVLSPGWGGSNTFSQNTADVGGPGFGIRIDVDAGGNVVSCDNVVSHAESGFANVACS